jgi:hypothetical protein
MARVEIPNYSILTNKEQRKHKHTPIGRPKVKLGIQDGVIVHNLWPNPGLESRIRVETPICVINRPEKHLDVLQRELKK